MSNASGNTGNFGDQDEGAHKPPAVEDPINGLFDTLALVEAVKGRIQELNYEGVLDEDRSGMLVRSLRVIAKMLEQNTVALSDQMEALSRPAEELRRVK